ncbi:hypothetical protein Tco_0870828 [Tanacetum coccineum]
MDSRWLFLIMHDCHLESIFLDGLYGVDSRGKLLDLAAVVVVGAKYFLLVDWKFFGGPTYLVLVDSMKRKSQQSQFISGMQYRTTANKVQRCNYEFEMVLVQQAGLASVVKELVVFDRIGEHVEITSTSSGVEQKFTTPIKKSEFLAAIEPHTEPAYTIENCGLPYRHCIPILMVFKCFRNMPAAHVESDSMSRLGVGKRLLSNIFSPYVPVDRLEPQSLHVPALEVALYVYDTHDELSNRMHHFGGQDESTLNPEIVKGLIYVLDKHNGLVRLFRTERDDCNAGDIPSFKIRLYNIGGVRGYELPTTDVLGAIVFENGPRSRTDFDVIIEFRGGPPQRINKLHQSYMSL